MTTQVITGDTPTGLVTVEFPNVVIVDGEGPMGRPGEPGEPGPAGAAGIPEILDGGNF